MKCPLCQDEKTTGKAEACDVCGGKVHFASCLACGRNFAIDSESSKMSQYCERCLCSRENEEALKAQVALCKLVGLPYLVSWPELVGRVKYALEHGEGISDDSIKEVVEQNHKLITEKQRLIDETTTISESLRQIDHVQDLLSEALGLERVEKWETLVDKIRVLVFKLNGGGVTDESAKRELDLIDIHLTGRGFGLSDLWRDGLSRTQIITLVCGIARDHMEDTKKATDEMLDEVSGDGPRDYNEPIIIPSEEVEDPIKMLQSVIVVPPSNIDVLYGPVKTHYDSGGVKWEIVESVIQNQYRTLAIVYATNDNRRELEVRVKLSNKPGGIGQSGMEKICNVCAAALTDALDEITDDGMEETEQI